MLGDANSNCNIKVAGNNDCVLHQMVQGSMTDHCHCDNDNCHCAICYFTNIKSIVKKNVNKLEDWFLFVLGCVFILCKYRAKVM